MNRINLSVKRPALWVVLSLAGLQAMARNADTVDLHRCFELALENHPYAGQKEYYRKTYQLELSNTQNNWYPKLNANARATYQSDVTSISADPVLLPVPSPQNPTELDIAGNIPTPATDQYNIYLEVNQVIYDGKATGRKKNLDAASHRLNMSSVQVEMEKVKEQVNRSYFMILMMDKNREIMEASLNQLREKKKVVRTGMENGVLLASDLMELETRMLEVEQKLQELRFKKQSALNMLSSLTGIELSGQSHFNTPAFDIPSNDRINRPETKLFTRQQEKIDASRELVHSQRLPKVIAFSQAGYGRPGLNMLSDQFDSYFLMGVRVTWNIWDWKESSNQREQLALRKDIIETRQSQFDRNIRIGLSDRMSEIRKYEAFLQSDEGIIKARETMTRVAGEQLENGTLTMSDYLEKQMKEEQARLKKALHAIQLMMAKAQYLTMKGDI